MTEQQIRDRIKALRAEIKELNEKLPKKVWTTTEIHEDYMKNHYKPKYTTCKKCGSDKAEKLSLSIICDSCGHIHRFLDSVKL